MEIINNTKKFFGGTYGYDNYVANDSIVEKCCKLASFRDNCFKVIVHMLGSYSGSNPMVKFTALYKGRGTQNIKFFIDLSYDKNTGCTFPVDTIIGLLNGKSVKDITCIAFKDKSLAIHYYYGRVEEVVPTTINIIGAVTGA